VKVCINIPYQKNIFPTVLTDTYENILNYVFQTQNVYTMSVSDYSFVLSYEHYSYESIINHTATLIYRALKNDQPDSVLYGPVLLISNDNKLDPNILERICYVHANL